MMWQNHATAQNLNALMELVFRNEISPETSEYQIIQEVLC